MSGAHAFLPPSGAGAWVACAMWPTMNRLYPQDDTQPSLEGTAAHWVFEQEFAQREVQIGALAPNGVTLTEEMFEGAEQYVDIIDADLAKCGLDRRWLVVERRVEIPRVHAQNAGTPDTWFFDPHSFRLFLYDYKFGHDPVDAWRNWQCADYTAGIIDEVCAQYNWQRDALEAKLLVVVTVVQPRNYHRGSVSERWQVKVDELAPMWDRLQTSAAAACAPKPAATPGPQCDYCPGRHACDALQRQGYRAAHLSTVSNPVELPPAALGIELAMLEDAQRMLDARVSGLKEQAFARVQRGERVPGYAMEQGFGREAWTAPPAQIIATAAALKVDVSKPGVITPKQARDKGLPASIVALFAGKESKGYKLVRDDGTAATKVFGKTN